VTGTFFFVDCSGGRFSERPRGYQVYCAHERPAAAVTDPFALSATPEADAPVPDPVQIFESDGTVENGADVT